MKHLLFEPEHFKDRIIFMSMCTTTLHWEKKEIQKDVSAIHRQLRIMLANSLAVIGLSWGLGQKRNGTEPTPTNPTDPGTKLQRIWRRISQIPVTQYFVPPLPLREENWGAKDMARSLYTSTVAMKTSSCFSARWFLWNQLSVYGAVADLCNELSEELGASGQPGAPHHSETMENTNTQQRGNLVQKYERKIEQLSEDQKLSKLCYDAGLKLGEKEQYFYTLDTEEGKEMQHSCREYTMPRNEKKTRAKGWMLKNTRIGPVLNMIDTVSKFWSNLCLKTMPFLGLESWMVLIQTWPKRCWPRKKRT